MGQQYGIALAIYRACSHVCKIAPAIGLAKFSTTTKPVMKRTCKGACNGACKAEASKAGGGAITTLGSVLGLPRGLTAPITVKT